MDSFFYNWEDLEKHGIRSQGAGTCGMEWRNMYSLTDQGAQLVQGFLGVVLRDHPFNTGGKSSILLTPRTVIDLMIFIALTEHKFVVIVWREPDPIWPTIRGFDDEDQCIHFREIVQPLPHEVRVRQGDSLNGLRNQSRFIGMPTGIPF